MYKIWNLLRYWMSISLRANFGQILASLLWVEVAFGYQMVPHYRKFKNELANASLVYYSCFSSFVLSFKESADSYLSSCAPADILTFFFSLLKCVAQRICQQPYLGYNPKISTNRKRFYKPKKSLFLDTMGYLLVSVLFCFNYNMPISDERWRGPFGNPPASWGYIILMFPIIMAYVFWTHNYCIIRKLNTINGLCTL